jgi:hypothetical protein
MFLHRKFKILSVHHFSAHRSLVYINTIRIGFFYFDMVNYYIRASHIECQELFIYNLVPEPWGQSRFKQHKQTYLHGYYLDIYFTQGCSPNCYKLKSSLQDGSQA